MTDMGKIVQLVAYDGSLFALDSQGRVSLLVEAAEQLVKLPENEWFAIAPFHRVNLYPEVSVQLATDPL